MHSCGGATNQQNPTTLNEDNQMKMKAIMILSVALVATSLAACQPPPTIVIEENQSADYLRQGIIFASQNDFNNAIEAFEKSVELRPSPDGYANLGASYMQLGKRNLAMSALNKAEWMNPGHSLTLYNMMALHSLNDNTDLALEYLDRTLKSGFDNYDAIRFDPDLANLRGEPEFRTILESRGIFIQ